jgi:3-hydroxyisobutyrate dehydrogenase-like beta-hydroxyacid dehydrogenase
MRVALLGLGQMGAPIAQRLEAAGHELAVWNRSPAPAQPFAERGVVVLDHPADAWEHADLAITMLADGAAVEAVALGERGLLSAAGGAQRRVLLDMSTISANDSAVIAAACADRGVAFLRGPVTGNPSVVVAGNLGIIVSGPREEFERLSATLSHIGPNLFFVGAAEEARIVKLALNLMIGGTAELIAEALVLAEKHGIGRREMLDVMGGSAIGSPFVKYKTEALCSDDYSSTFSAQLMYKDLGLVLAAADEVALPLPLVAAVQQLIQGCIATGMGELDFTVLLPRLRREAGLDGPPATSRG